MESNQLFFVSLKAFIEKENQLLLLINSDGGLDFPGGQIQMEENNLEEILQREVMEETGLTIKMEKPVATWKMDFTNPNKSVFFVVYKCKYLSGEVNLSSEHQDYHWVSKENYSSFQQDSIWFKQVEKYFSVK